MLGIFTIISNLQKRNLNLKALNRNKIFLIGFMGVGKTKLGRKLAKHLDVEFYDIDEIIEHDMDKSINQIFDELGENEFRRFETETLKTIIDYDENCVVSVGGGLPCFNDNMTLMNESGTTLYLHRPNKELFKRLKQNKANRPLIKDLNDEELLKFIEETVSQREEFYNQALVKVERENQNIKEIASLLK